MADDTRSRSGQDRTQINTGQDYEVQYWTKELGCTPEQLRTAVLQVGPLVDAVRKYLSQSKEKA